jgi:hypothetical protein
LNLNITKGGGSAKLIPYYHTEMSEHGGGSGEQEVLRFALDVQDDDVCTVLFPF